MLEVTQLLDILSPGNLHREERNRMLEINRQICSDPEIGRLIELVGLSRLVEILELSDEIFSDVYPETSLTPNDRKALKQAAQAHVDNCERCRLVADNHQWADAVLVRLMNQKTARERKAPLNKSRKTKQPSPLHVRRKEVAALVLT